MKVKKMMIVMALLTTTLLEAQFAIDRPYIEVNGESEMALLPDQIIVSVVLK